MGNAPPPPGSPWPTEPEGPRPHARPQSSPAWAWPPAPTAAHGHDSAVWAWPPPRPARPTRLAGPPPGSEFHRVARTAWFRWWVPPLALATAIALSQLIQVPIGLFAGLIALASGGPLDSDVLFGSAVPDLAVQLVVVAMLTPSVLVAARFVQRRGAGTLSSVEGRLRWRWLLLCAAVATLCVVLALAVLAAAPGALGPRVPTGSFAGTGEFAAGMIVVLLLVPFQAAGEEYAFRGFLLQIIGGYGARPGELAARGRADGPVSRLLRGPVPAIVVSAVAFTSLHAYGGWATAEVLVFGLAVGWLAWYTGGLEAGIALHVLHNIAGFGLSAYTGALDRQGTGSGSWQSLAGTVLEIGLYVLVVVWLARRRGLRRTVPGEPAALPAASARPPGPAERTAGLRSDRPGSAPADGPAGPSEAPPVTTWRPPGGHRHS
ncbi:type II CAAX endopeptidase family protein [Marinitenerispora sediminis]|uniref:CPBP family intramembrane metalloprotease domain-containing protein n=1 Tax=Marinitenerispora sediminis TaxID=1931232 RepID=A0A368SZS8_9ACTN|nr:type II CAAX endopeptidase family protein [Marinitenerispora sediminis]RCV50541.1 CPBP family intramembrane metalloprotease domain-containing protein [Marinitenerispora sediminis]RCV51748.1 CPBP family intramembrane metalloprotease domain-containing protein [Marinitenerispora sediminis]RCV59389.1 CPBP family intramembrane metalloprotease domain-containing protein [Marinitenerispora sediminis]